MKTFLFAMAVASGLSVVQADVLLSEDFDYPDGPLQSVSSGKWQNHSGVSGAIDVQSGHALLSELEDEDINSLLAGAPILVSSPAVLYSRFTFSFTTLPSGAGDYFAHFSDLGNGFRALIFASTNGAAAGKLRLGVTRSAVAASQAAFLPIDLLPNTAYSVVTRHFLAGGFTTLWVNPTNEIDTRVDSTDPPSSLSLWVYALRESGTGEAGMGGIVIDDLRVGQTFGDVVDFPLKLAVMGYGNGEINLIFQTLRGRQYRVEFRDDLSSANWQTLFDNLDGTGSTLLVRDTPGGTNRFYRLMQLP